MFASSLVLALVVGTWNGEWFPSGRAEHRANDQVERATIRAAGQMLADGISEVDPSGKEDILLCLSEIRDLETAQALCTAIGRELEPLEDAQGHDSATWICTCGSCRVASSNCDCVCSSFKVQLWPDVRSHCPDESTQTRLRDRAACRTGKTEARQVSGASDNCR